MARATTTNATNTPSVARTRRGDQPRMYLAGELTSDRSAAPGGACGAARGRVGGRRRYRRRPRSRSRPVIATDRITMRARMPPPSARPPGEVVGVLSSAAVFLAPVVEPCEEPDVETAALSLWGFLSLSGQVTRTVV